VKPSETILIALLVIAAFLLSDFLVEQFTVIGAVQRLILRIGFLAQFFAVIYVLFTTRDNARRIRELEKQSGGGDDAADQE